MTSCLHRIALGPNTVGEALALVGAIADPARAETQTRLAVVVEELVANLVDHGEGGTAIWLALEPVEAGVRVVLIDDAAPFDPRAAAPMSDLPNEERGGGAGLAMVGAWSRILDYTRVGERNRLELIVDRDPEER